MGSMPTLKSQNHVLSNNEFESILASMKEETDKCIGCGFCESACPTLNAKDYYLYYGSRGRMALARELSKKRDKEFFDFLRDSQNAFDSCLNCYACLTECPVGANPGKVSKLAKNLVITERRSGLSPNPISEFITLPIKKYNNPLGLKKECFEWSENLNLPEEGEYLLFTGCMYQMMPYSSKLISITKKTGERSSRRFASIGKRFPSAVKLSRFMYDAEEKERTAGILHSIVKLLRLSNIDFYYDRELELYAGAFLNDLGFKEDFEKYAESIAKKLKEKHVKKIITVDPHSYDLLKNVYPTLTDFSVDVYFYLDLININMKKSDTTVTFHDPCYLSRHSDYTERPREILSNVTELIEPANNRKRSMCCGGPSELLYPDITEKVAAKRYAELKNTGAQMILTSCPVCFANLNRGAEVHDISEFLLMNSQ